MHVGDRFIDRCTRADYQFIAVCTPVGHQARTVRVWSFGEGNHQPSEGQPQRRHRAGVRDVVAQHRRQRPGHHVLRQARVHAGQLIRGTCTCIACTAAVTAPLWHCSTHSN